MKQNRYVKLLVNTLLALALPVAVFLVFTLLSGGRMANQRTIMAILRQSIQPAIICLGLMLGMRLGMMNFACGAIVLCSAICGMGISNVLGLGLPGFIVFAMLVSLACSALYGFLYNKLRVPCMVLGLGMMLVYEALPRVFFSGGASIKAADGFLARSPYCFWVLLTCILVFYVLFNKTAYGHNLRAVGANQAIAIASGLDLDKIKFQNFIVGGIFLGVAAVLHLSSSGSLNNVAALGSMTVMMDAFMGVFLGMLLGRWIDLSVAIYLGVVTMKIISNGFVAIGMSATWQDVVTGVFLLAVMAVSANAALPERLRLDKLFAAQADAEYAKQAG